LTTGRGRGGNPALFMHMMEAKEQGEGFETKGIKRRWVGVSVGKLSCDEAWILNFLGM
jgi:hypothetical protein